MPPNREIRGGVSLFRSRSSRPKTTATIPPAARTGGPTRRLCQTWVRPALTAIGFRVEHVRVAAGPLTQVESLAAVHRAVRAGVAVGLRWSRRAPVDLARVHGRGVRAGRLEAHEDRVGI